MHHCRRLDGHPGQLTGTAVAHDFNIMLTVVASAIWEDGEQELG